MQNAILVLVFFSILPKDQSYYPECLVTKGVKYIKGKRYEIKVSMVFKLEHCGKLIALTKEKKSNNNYYDYEEFTLSEMVDFHFKFKTFKPGIDKAALNEILNLKGSDNKMIRYFSSGMKQRLKLALAFCADTPMLMLDEPTSNLDTQGIDWYLNLVEKFSANRLTIICSNQEHEYSFCEQKLNISDYKG